MSSVRQHLNFVIDTIPDRLICGAVLWAMSVLTMAPVVALRETSVVSGIGGR